MHDSVGQFQTTYVNLDICHEPLVSNRWYQKPKIPSSLLVIARQALLENLIKFRICKIFLLLIKKKNLTSSQRLSQNVIISSTVYIGGRITKQM